MEGERRNEREGRERGGREREGYRLRERGRQRGRGVRLVREVTERERATMCAEARMMECGSLFGSIAHFPLLLPSMNFCPRVLLGMATRLRRWVISSGGQSLSFDSRRDDRLVLCAAPEAFEERKLELSVQPDIERLLQAGKQWETLPTAWPRVTAVVLSLGKGCTKLHFFRTEGIGLFHVTRDGQREVYASGQAMEIPAGDLGGVLVCASSRLAPPLSHTAREAAAAHLTACPPS